MATDYPSHGKSGDACKRSCEHRRTEAFENPNTEEEFKPQKDHMCSCARRASLSI